MSKSETLSHLTRSVRKVGEHYITDEYTHNGQSTTVSKVKPPEAVSRDLRPIVYAKPDNSEPVGNSSLGKAMGMAIGPQGQ